VTPAPPLLIQRVYLSLTSCAPNSDTSSSENSEPVGPYVSVPAFSYPATGYQPPQPTYGPTLTAATISVPMPSPSTAPTGVVHGFPSPQYPSRTGTPLESSVQARAVYASQYTRSQMRKPLVSQEMDALEPTRRDPRCHPLFRHSRCSGRRKALCVRTSS